MSPLQIHLNLCFGLRPFPVAAGLFSPESPSTGRTLCFSPKSPSPDRRRFFVGLLRSPMIKAPNACRLSARIKAMAQPNPGPAVAGNPSKVFGKHHSEAPDVGPIIVYGLHNHFKGLGIPAATDLSSSEPHATPGLSCGRDRP